MKKDRNCISGAYPVYPVNMGYMPSMPVPGPVMPMGNQMSMTNQIPMSTSYISTNDNSLTAKVDNLEKRVTRLENMISSNNVAPSYSESNFYMV